MSDAPPPPLPANRLSEYTLRHTLGEGTFGKVVMASTTATGEVVATKFLKPIAAEKEEAAELADREARALTLFSQSARHRNVLRAEGIIDFKASSDAASEEALRKVCPGATKAFVRELALTSLRI